MFQENLLPIKPNGSGWRKSSFVVLTVFVMTAILNFAGV